MGGTLYTPFNYHNLFIYFFPYLLKSYHSLIALILPIILSVSLFAPHSCFYLEIQGTEWPFMC